MQLIAVTPGVSMAAVRGRNLASHHGLTLAIRVLPCGKLTREPPDFAAITVVVTPCAVSLHAADRLLKSLCNTDRFCEVRVRGDSALPAWLHTRFRVPVGRL